MLYLILELETAVHTFREILRQAWIRQAVRGLTMENPPSILSKFTLETIRAHRDPGWVNKEEGYHETAVAELNSLVRKYNAVAPYAVRRPYYIREVEIERAYDEAASDIMQMIAKRAQEADSTLRSGNSGTSQGAGGHSSAGGPSSEILDTSEKVHGVIATVQWLRLVFRLLFGIKRPS
jgi:DnaJ family protein C protein 28